MGLFERFKAGLQKTQARLVHEIKRIVSRSPRLNAASLEEIEAALLGADLGASATQRILGAVRTAYETQGKGGADVLAVATAELQRALAGAESPLARAPNGLTIVSVVGVNGTGKTTTAAKLAGLLKAQNHTVLLAACDTFRAAAIEQLRIWGERLHVHVVAGAYGADPASVAHDAVTSALARKADYLIIDTAGRLHTKQNLMSELQKLHRVIAKLQPGAPHEIFLVLDANTGMNALNQARQFHQAVSLTGLVVTKLDGTSKGGIIVAIQHELGLPIKFIGLGEQAADLQPFKAAEFAQALFTE